MLNSMLDPAPDVPRHLRGMLVNAVLPVQTSWGDVTGDISCLCGNRELSLLYSGDRNQDEHFLAPLHIDGHFFYRWSFRCNRCWREELIFDSDFHGYNGLHANSNECREQPRPSLSIWECHKCGYRQHSISILVRLDVDAIEEGVNAEHWYDAYEWFSLSTRCEGCGLDSTPGQCETA